MTSKIIVTKQENIFGEDQAFTDMHQSRAASSSPAGNPATGAADRGADISTSTGATDEADLLKQKEFDTRQYRPFEVAVSITMHDIQAHLIKVSDRDWRNRLLNIFKVDISVEIWLHSIRSFLKSLWLLMFKETTIGLYPESFLSRAHLYFLFAQGLFNITPSPSMPWCPTISLPMSSLN